MSCPGNSALAVISLTDIPPSLVVISLPINMPRPSPKTSHPISITLLKILLYNSGHYKDNVFWGATYNYSGVRLTILQLYVPEFLRCMSWNSSGYTPKFLLCVLELSWSVSYKSAGVCPRALTVWCQKSYRVFLGNRLVYAAGLFLCMTHKSDVCPRSLLKCVPEALNLCKSILRCNWEAMPLYSICTFVCRNGFM